MKKLLLSLGILPLAILPIITAVSCSSDNKNAIAKIITLKKEYTKDQILEADLILKDTNHSIGERLKAYRLIFDNINSAHVELITYSSDITNELNPWLQIETKDAKKLNFGLNPDNTPITTLKTKSWI